MSHRSFSSVKTLRSCGEQFRLERVEKLPQRPSTAAIAGRVVHQSTELVDYEIASGETDAEILFYNATRLAGEVLETEVRENISTLYPNVESWRSFGQSKTNPRGQDLEWFRRTGIPGSIQNYIHWRLNEKPQYELLVLPSGELAIEVPFEMTLGEVVIKGQIDRVFTDTSSGINVVLDIKNGPRPDSTEQLGLYREAMLEIHPDGGPYFGSFLCNLKPNERTRPNQTFPNAMTSWTRERLTSIYTQADKQIVNEIFLPNPGKSCFMCSVSEACPFFAASTF